MHISEKKNRCHDQTSGRQSINKRNVFFVHTYPGEVNRWGNFTVYEQRIMTHLLIKTLGTKGLSLFHTA